MQSARYFIAAFRAAEFSAGMELCHHELERRDLVLFVNIYGDAAAIVVDGDRVVWKHRDRDLGRVASHGLVKGVVHGLAQEMK